MVIQNEIDTMREWKSDLGIVLELQEYIHCMYTLYSIFTCVSYSAGQLLHNILAKVPLNILSWLSSCIDHAIECIMDPCIAHPKDFDPIFCWLAGHVQYCKNLHLPRNGTSCSSIVTQSLGTNTFLQLARKQSHTYLNAAMWSVSSLTALVLLSSNRMRQQISSYLWNPMVALYIGFCRGSRKSSCKATS